MADFQSIFSLFLICLISIVLIYRVFFKSAPAKSHLPPSPLALPIIGHLHLLYPSPHQALHKLSLRYGPVFRVLLGSLPCVVACSPETAIQFLKVEENSFLDRPKNPALDYLTYGTKDYVFATHGPYWKFIRNIVKSQLLNGTTLDLLRSVRQDEINRFMKSLSQHVKEGKAVDVREELMQTTNNVISRMIMNERCWDKECDAEDLRKLVAEIGDVIVSDNIWVFTNLDLLGLGKKLKDIGRRYDELLDRIIKEHEDARRKKEMGSQGKDWLSILLHIAEDESMEIDLTKEHIKALIMDFLIAGSDTTALTIEWALAELINHPNIMKKAIQEIDDIIGKNRLLEESDIPNLPYLRSIVKETLRLHTPGPFIPRKATKDCIVEGYHIPKNTNIYICIWALSRDPNYWETPFEFRPERFLENHLGVRGEHFHLLPFGSGKRMCPGASLALLMVQTTLGAIIQCFEWKAGKDGNLTSVDMEERGNIVVSRVNPLVCVPVARLDSIQSLK